MDQQSSNTSASLTKGAGTAAGFTPTPEWLATHEQLLGMALANERPGRVQRFLNGMLGRMRERGLDAPRSTSTPYVNTIAPDRQPASPAGRPPDARPGGGRIMSPTPDHLMSARTGEHRGEEAR